MSESGQEPACRDGACPKVDMGPRVAMGRIQLPQYRTISLTAPTGSTKVMCRILRDFRQAPAPRVDPSCLGSRLITSQEPAPILFRCTQRAQTDRCRNRCDDAIFEAHQPSRGRSPRAMREGRGTEGGAPATGWRPGVWGPVSRAARSASTKRRASTPSARGNPGSEMGPVGPCGISPRCRRILRA